jgi:hypothetical protein
MRINCVCLTDTVCCCAGAFEVPPPPDDDADDGGEDVIVGRPASPSLVVGAVGSVVGTHATPVTSVTMTSSPIAVRGAAGSARVNATVCYVVCVVYARACVCVYARACVCVCACVCVRTSHCTHTVQHSNSTTGRPTAFVSRRVPSIAGL